MGRGGGHCRDMAVRLWRVTQISVQCTPSIRPGRISWITAMAITPLAFRDCSASWGLTVRGMTPPSRYTDRKIHGNSSS
jgi:hypothetical protein